MLSLNVRRPQPEIGERRASQAQHRLRRFVQSVSSYRSSLRRRQSSTNGLACGQARGSRFRGKEMSTKTPRRSTQNVTAAAQRNPT